MKYVYPLLFGPFLSWMGLHAVSFWHIKIETCHLASPKLNVLLTMPKIQNRGESLPKKFRGQKLRNFERIWANKEYVRINVRVVSYLIALEKVYWSPWKVLEFWVGVALHVNCMNPDYVTKRIFEGYNYIWSLHLSEFKAKQLIKFNYIFGSFYWGWFQNFVIHGNQDRSLLLW